MPFPEDDVLLGFGKPRIFGVNGAATGTRNLLLKPLSFLLLLLSPRAYKTQTKHVIAVLSRVYGMVGSAGQTKNCTSWLSSKDWFSCHINQGRFDRLDAVPSESESRG